MNLSSTSSLHFRLRLSRATGRTWEVRALLHHVRHSSVPTDFVTSLSTNSPGRFVSVTFYYGHFTSTLIASLAPPAVSLHREDGSSPRFIATSLPDGSDHGADEQGENIHLICAQRAQHSSRLAETHTLDSFNVSEVATSEDNRPRPVMQASIPPVDGEPIHPSL